ncbi:hypothetical protein VitviT2T_001894 [Vitis vinifera]|uniref:Retrovirus-related Pol polyprotein from transposon RE1 n=1 Tax=Vitis vinifera TaxID=29760 RepID=A0ABY9BHH0_VITVI|nr:hypothetical protein VitviT2T_001894 [Vitis vinifera]
MDLETPKQVWDKLQGEFEGSDKVKTVRLLTLKREFELMKMKDNESVKDYSSKLMDVVNQMRFLGEAFTDQKVVEKIMVSVPQKFEAKISAIEESCDLQSLTIAELTNKLHAQEQRVLIEKYYRAKKKQSQQQTQQHANVIEEDKKDNEHLFMASQALNSHELNTWLIDSGHTNHMTKHLSIFTSIDKSVQPKVKLGNGEAVQAKGKETIAISTKRGKLDERAEKGVFVGYAAESKGYIIYSLSRMKIVISRDMYFDENSYWNWDLKKVHKCDQTTPSILEPAIESTSIEDPLDVEATSDTPVLKAIKVEIDVIERNGTWKLIELSETKKAIGVKWVFRTKFNSYGLIFKHKARLVVKGFAQVSGVDYDDTFAPVARHDTIRLLLALVGQMGRKVYHLDVKSAFLNVYKLHKALYGLKQAPRAWYSRIDSHLIQLGFRRSENEATLYLKQNEDGLQLVVSLYVDDMLVAGSNVRLLAKFKMEMQDRKYVVDILKKFKLESCKEVATPLTQNEKISKNDGEKLKKPSAYRSLVGSLLYLTATRPNLMFPTGLLSRFMSSPNNVHMGVAKRVLKYVRGTTNLGIWLCIFNRFKCRLLEFKKARSSGTINYRAEYISLATAANQGIWLKKLLVNLGQKQSSLIKLYYDNKLVIAIAQNPIQHGKTTHINVKFHSIRETEKNSLVKLHYCSTDVQLVDIMTKALPKSRLELLRLKLGMSKANLKEEC